MILYLQPLSFLIKQIILPKKKSNWEWKLTVQFYSTPQVSGLHILLVSQQSIYPILHLFEIVCNKVANKSRYWIFLELNYSEK
jgi:hypothetical protein